MKLPIICSIFIVLLFKPVFPLDYVKLHDKEYEISLNEAIENSINDPDSLNDKYILGLSYLRENDFDKAYKIFREMMDTDECVIEAKWGIAEILRSKHDLKGSEELLNGIMEQDPDFLPAYISFAYIKQSQGDYFKCIELSDQVIQKHIKNNDTANYVRALCLSAGACGMIAQKGNIFMKVIYGSRVLPYLRKAEEIRPDSSAVLYGLGCYYLMAYPGFGRDLDKSEDYLKRLVKKDANFADGYVRLAQIYNIRGQKEEYLRSINKALEIDPKNKLAISLRSGANDPVYIN